MEEVSDKLKQALLKKESVSKAHEQLHADASKVLLLTVPWKDLEEHFDDILRSLQCCFKKLLESERSLEERVRAVESKEDELCSFQRRIEECKGEFGRKTRELASVEEEVERLHDERGSEEKRLVQVRGALSDCVSLIRDKEEELSSLRRSTEECLMNYKSKKEEMELLQQKVNLQEKNVEALQKLLEETSRELALEIEKLGLARSSHKVLSREVDLKRQDLDMFRNQVEDSYKAMGTRNNQLSILEHPIKEHPIKEFERVIALKHGELQSLTDKINDCCLELQVKEEELGQVKEGVNKFNEALKSKESLLDSIKTLITENEEELESKEKEFDAINKLVNERSATLDMKERELGFIERTIGKLSEELKSKEGHLEGMRKCVKQLEKEMKSKKVKLASVERKARTSHEYMCRKLDATKESIKGLNLEIESKRKQLESIEIHLRKSAEGHRLKEREYASIQSSILECSVTFKSKKKQLDLTQKSIAECSKELELRKRQLDQIEERRKEGCRDLELKEKHLNVLHVAIEECSKILEKKEKECEVRCMELELRRKPLDSIEKTLETRSWELESRESFNVLSGGTAHALVNGSASASQVNFQPGIVDDGKNLLMVLGQQFKEHDRVCSKVLERIQTSPDAAKLVLDAIEGFYPQDLNNGDGFDIGTIRRICIFLLESIIKLSAEVTPQVREGAMKLALEWKAKLNVLPSPENYMEMLGFLQLLSAYKLDSAFDKNEIQNLLNLVAQFRKEHGLYQLLGSSDAQPGSLRSIPQCQIKIESEHCIVHEDSSCVIPPPSTGSVGGTLQFPQIEFPNENHAILKEMLDILQSSSNPAKLVLGVIEGSYKEFSNDTNMNFNIDVHRTLIFLLEHLIKISPSTTNEVKEGAMKLAREWKVRLKEKAESSLEVFSFLHFLAAFKLASSFSENEILELANRVSLNDNAPLLCQTLGLANRVTAPASTPDSFSGVHPQLPRHKKRTASEPGIVQQSQQHAHKRRDVMKNPVRPV
ncbi:hypothetical protein BT93_A0463 [Corymbia citriodora subsp. variegata]|nr:hypothetical protein BT93_A0463 [Corymbia citriodora subsp. variegata]